MLSHGRQETELNKDMHITSSDMDPSLYAELPQTLGDLALYLEENSLFRFADIWSRIKDLMGHVADAYRTKLGRNPRYFSTTMFQLFGADVVIRGNDAIPFLLEFNKGPNMKPVNEKDMQMKTKIFRDCFYSVLPNRQHESDFIEL